MGTNCELCEMGWYRPTGVKPDAAEPCVACDCHPDGSDGNMCFSDKDTVSSFFFGGGRVRSIFHAVSINREPFLFLRTERRTLQLSQRVRRRQMRRMRTRVQRISRLQTVRVWRSRNENGSVIMRKPMRLQSIIIHLSCLYNCTQCWESSF